MPEKVKIQLCPPPSYEQSSPQAFANTIKRRVSQAEFAIHKARKGQPFLGSTKIRAQSPWTLPSPSQVKENNLNPRIAAKDKKRRQGLLKILKNFRADYREAIQRFCNGEQGVIFPGGTYKMKKLFNVECEHVVYLCPNPT